MVFFPVNGHFEILRRSPQPRWAGIVIVLIVAELDVKKREPSLKLTRSPAIIIGRTCGGKDWDCIAKVDRAEFQNRSSPAEKKRKPTSDRGDHDISLALSSHQVNAS